MAVFGALGWLYQKLKCSGRRFVPQSIAALQKVRKAFLEWKKFLPSRRRVSLTVLSETIGSIWA
jgi:hypothetical protein